LRDFVAGHVPVARLAVLVEQCRQEVKALALENTASLLKAAVEAASDARTPGGPSPEIMSTLQEVLTVLATEGVDKLSAYDKSLAITVHRARLERLRLR
jgi:hypothetical protein